MKKNLLGLVPLGFFLLGVYGAIQHDMMAVAAAVVLGFPLSYAAGAAFATFVAEDMTRSRGISTRSN